MKVLTPDFWQKFWQHVIEVVASRGLLILGVLLGFFIIRGLINRIVDGSVARLLAREDRHGSNEERGNRLRTLQGISKSVVQYGLFFVLIIMLLDAVGANVAGIITTAGIGGIALGLGCQRIVRDVVSGFFIIIEDQFAVGDYVTISGAAGTMAASGAAGVVESLDMRITRIRDDTGRRWVLANGDITAVINHSRTPVETSIDIGIAPDTNVDQAEAAIDEAGEEMLAKSEGRLISAPKSAGVSSWDDSRTNIRVVFIADPRHVSAEQLRVRKVLRKKLVDKRIAVA